MPSPLPSNRSQAFFEEYRGRTTALQMPVQPLEPGVSFEALGIRNTPLARLLAGAAFRLSGFSGFHRRLPESLDSLVEASYQVSATGPVVAATMALVDPPRHADAFLRAAAMLCACREIRRELGAGLFAPDQHRDEPLEMRQYLNLFGTMSAFDGGRFRLFKSQTERLLVLARGVPFIVGIGPEDAWPSVHAVAAALKQVWAASERQAGGEDGGFGWLSCLPLAEQEMQLRGLLEDDALARAYEQLRETFVTVCLDMDRTPRDLAEEARAAHSGNCGNRWFHSSLQLVVFGNARAAVICDFNAGLGGNTMMRAAVEIHRRSLPLLSQEMAERSSTVIDVEPLAWKGDRDRVRANAASVRPLLDEQPATFELHGRGRAAFAAKNLDAVPVFSAAVQLAVLRLTRRFVRVRQFVSQAKYRAHNVALALVSTKEMRELVEGFAAGNLAGERVRELLRAAIDAQREQNRNARAYVSVARSLQMFRGLHTGGRVRCTFDSLFRVLRALNLYAPPPPTDVVLSHPDLFPEVPIMGRPGVRLPYVGCFGLHYLIWDDRITVTVMPSTRWTIPNATLVAEIESSLDEIMSAF